MTKTILTALLLATSSASPWRYETPYRMPASRLAAEAGRSDTAWYFDTTANAGSYARLGVPVHDGGWSGLEFDSSDASGSSFWTISEGGLITSRESATRNDRIVAFPGYHQKLVHVLLEGDSLRIDRTDSIATWGNPSAFTTGLQNTVSSSDATQLRMDLASGAIDTTAKIATSADGYDFEAIRARHGWFWIADESGPFILKVSPSTHRIEKQWYPDNGLPKVYLRRRANRSFEALAVTPSGLVAAMLQSPMLNAQGSVDNSTTRDSRVVRMLLLDPATGSVREHVYLNDQKPNAMGATRKGRDCKIGDMVALDDHRFLVVEHGADAAGKYWIDVWMVDVAGATNVTASNKIGMTFSGGGLTLEQLSDSATLAANGIVPVAKTLVRSDIRGTTPWRSTQPEGLAVVDDTTIALLSDDNLGCRDMEASGNPDGICHIQSADLSRSTLMYFRTPSLGWSRVAVGERVRGPVPGFSPTRDGIVVAWPARSRPFAVLVADAAGRTVRRWDLATTDASGSRLLPLGGLHGVLTAALVRDGRVEAARLLPRP